MVSAAIGYLINFGPRIDEAPSIDRLPELVELAEREKLTVYDAIYLQLALSSNAPLATIDADVRAAAKRLDIPLIPA
jgi:predicted nucleic acid-binding protein